MSRSSFLAAVVTHFPGAFNYIKLAYDQPSTLLCQNQSLLSAEGAQQGDPLGPLLFCLAIQPIISRLKCPLNVWYLDDGTIGGTLTHVLSDFATIKEESQKIGLEVNVAKSEMFCQNIVDIQKLDEGLKVLKRQLSLPARRSFNRKQH